MDVPIWAWMALAVVILALLGIDLARHRDDHASTQKEALLESAAWVGCGLAFSGVVALAWGPDAFGEYLSGYLIEKSLSVDNVFVWSILLTTLAVPLKYQHRVLFWGIFGALALRGLFIAVGSSLINRFTFVLFGFGAFLIYTGFKVIRHRDDEGQGASRVLALVRRFMPISAHLDGHKFITKIDGKRLATPLLAALVVVEITDVVFAVDSVPAILAVSREPFLVFSSNAFAILGLRALYFVLAGARQRFHYLSHGLGAILIFVGIKMAIADWYHVDTFVSLGAITVMLTTAILLSARRTRRSRVKAADGD
ncbi:MAG: tellurium resistance protein TerC [Actinobacteria bacterium RBG_16_67_15]|nr:MAG: tellurium resistance protein TerC [Actinobacteria bacterium RBG_16_67_15]